MSTTAAYFRLVNQLISGLAPPCQRLHIWPLYDKGERWDSNPRQPESQSGALPTELRSPYTRLAGLEPATLGLEGRCSIQLSYRRIRFRGGGIRTPDILLPKQARYQTALHPDDFLFVRKQQKSSHILSSNHQKVNMTNIDSHNKPHRHNPAYTNGANTESNQDHIPFP